MPLCLSSSGAGIVGANLVRLVPPVILPGRALRAGSVDRRYRLFRHGEPERQRGIYVSPAASRHCPGKCTHRSVGIIRSVV